MNAVADQDLFAPPVPINDQDAALELCKAARSIDELKDVLGHLPQVEAPVEHIFTPGLYTRQITMLAGSMIISKIHKHRHPYVISKGRCSVFTREAGWVNLSAPFTGITEPGTERLLLIHEDTIWTTFHVTDETNLEKIEDHVIAKSMDECAAFLQNQNKGTLK